MAKRVALSIIVAVAALGLGLLRCASAYAATSVLLNDFGVTDFDEQVSILNPLGSNVCALIYVFDNAQNLQDCCGCPLSGNGLLDLSVDVNLLPISSTVTRGMVEIVPARPNASGQCNPTSVTIANAAVLQAAEYQSFADGIYSCLNITVIRYPYSNNVSSGPSTKTFFSNVTIQTPDATKLSQLCKASSASCSCGVEPQ